MPSPRIEKKHPTEIGRILISAMIAILLAASNIGWTLASSGFPNSAEFGYGIRISANPGGYEGLIQAASEKGFDWIGVDFIWSQQWPNQNESPQLQELDRLMAAAQKHQVNVLLALTRAPDWAMTAEGPDPGLTADLIRLLTIRYPANNLAIELFPGANTVRGWGASPNPATYMRLLSASMEMIKPITNHVTIVAAGLAPGSQSSQAQDWDDLEYLKALYTFGAAEVMPIVSIRLGEVAGDPLAPPESEPQTSSLRHYEKVRQLMLGQGHRNGLIWITGFSWSISKSHQGQTISSGKASIRAPSGANQDNIRWLARAYHQIKSQLYIGAAFFDASALNNDRDRSFSASPNEGMGSEQPAPLNTEISLIEEISLIQDNHNQSGDTASEPKVITDRIYKSSLKPTFP
jgi:hypothetical protein